MQCTIKENVFKLLWPTPEFLMVKQKYPIFFVLAV